LLDATRMTRSWLPHAGSARSQKNCISQNGKTFSTKRAANAARQRQQHFDDTATERRRLRDRLIQFINSTLMD
jgi:hypothetical protein